MERVKTPGPPAPEQAGTHGETPVRAWAYALAAAAWVLVASPALAAGGTSEPLCDWLSGLAAAAQAQAEGDHAGAAGAAGRALAARPRGVAAARAQASLGLALLALDATADAAEALETALGSPVPARAHLAFARGRALLAAGDAPGAARLFAEAGASDAAISTEARLREAEALLSAGLAPEAAPVLEAVVAATGDEAISARARLALGHALRAVGAADRAAATWRALWVELPERAEGAAAGAVLASWRAAGGPVPHESGVEHALRADRLLAAARPEDALLALEAAARAEEPPADAERVAALRAMALLSLGRHAEAERAALPVSGAAAADVQRAARLVLARAAARAGRVEEASRFYADVAAGAAPIPGLPSWRQRDVGDEAAFLSAWLSYDAGDFETAIARLEAFARANPRSRRAEDALWFAAWSRYRLGRAAEAERAFAALARGPLGDAALYWQARLARSPARQKALYRAALARAGESWYGLLARARLAALGAPPARPRRSPSRPLPEAQDAFAAGRLSVAVELLGLGLRAEALAELRDLARSGRVRPAAPLLAQLAAFAGDPDLPFRMARDHLSPSRRALRWAYPEPHDAALRRAAAAFRVDRALVLGVMRRESSFRADARSPAGAEGLLQLLPATAERVSALLGVAGGAGTRLRDPETNVTVGAHYLSLLLARFGEPAVAVAAYNAGPRPAAEWATARRGMSLDEWVESIPYRETRQYVKIVLAEWDAYRALAGEAAAPIDPARPIPAPGPGAAF